ncbi:hypothetical protein [Paraburkholderia adhaesiva]|uniref:hypothetical protein n=1 Tax=Paraburkholderia adhaesiva TaxID=2883244 RepID=UPI001F44DF54|nr:hypothetical protein [Paraburkholderia adhaesiva]
MKQVGLTIFGLVVFVTGLAVLYTSFRGAIYWMAVYSLFGCTLALGLPGGIGILPAQLFLLFFVVRAFNLAGGKQIANAFAIDKPGFWLLCTSLWGVFGAIVLPRLLRGSTLVFPVDRTMSGAVMLQRLGPVSGNLSQATYCLGDVVLYGCMYALLKYRGAYRALATGIFLLAFLDVLAGVIDVGTHAVGLDVMSVIKTAQYADLSGEVMGGLIRISGTFSEASAFASFTLPLFAFCLNLWLVGYRRKVAGALAFGTGMLLLLSTSGTAYAGLGTYLLVQLFSRPGRIARSAVARKQRLWILCACAGVLAALYAVLFLPGVVKVLGDFVNLAVLGKAASDSGVERMSWNAQGVKNFFDTYGIGVGLGSIRSSSFLVVVLANLGVVGVVCYGLFVGKSLLAPLPAQYPPTERAVSYAARHGMIATLIAASLAAGVFELGSCFYLFAAAAGALPLSASRRVPERQGWLAQQVHE